MNIDTSNNTGAHISKCGKYRYILWRNWNADLKKCAYVMLNPSTANEVDDDTTITRCMNRAKALNFGGIIVVNLFAYRATDPTELFSAHDPIGEENDTYLNYVASNAALMICAWGKATIVVHRMVFLNLCSVMFLIFHG